MTADVPLDELLEKVKDAISKQQPIKSDKQGTGDKECPHHFGFLAKLEQNATIPEECFLCSKVTKCMTS